MVFISKQTGQEMTIDERRAFMRYIAERTPNLDQLVEELEKVRVNDVPASIHELNQMLAEFDRRTCIAAMLDSFLQTPQEAMIIAQIVMFLEVARLRAQVISLGGTP